MLNFTSVKNAILFVFKTISQFQSTTVQMVSKLGSSAQAFLRFQNAKVTQQIFLNT